MRLGSLLTLLVLATGCSWDTVDDGAPAPRQVPGSVGDIDDAVPRFEPLGRYGNPEVYNAPGGPYRTWTRQRARGYRQAGKASWYGTKFHGRLTSSREVYDMYKMTAAHKHLPIPCYVRVTHRGTGRSVVVKVNDRGPFVRGRIIDLSYAAALKLGMTQQGVADVLVELIEPTAVSPTPVPVQAPLPGSSASGSPMVIPASAPAPAPERPVQPYPSPVTRIDTLPGAEPIQPLETETPLVLPDVPVVVPPPAPLPSERPTERMPGAEPWPPVQPVTEPVSGYEAGTGKAAAQSLQARFYVQVAVLSTEAAAIELAEALTTRHLGPVILRRVQVTGRPMQQVRVGPFSSRADARYQQRQIDRAGYLRTFVVRVPTGAVGQGPL